MNHYEPSEEEIALVTFFTKKSGEEFRVHEGSFQLSSDFETGWTGYQGDEAGFHELLQQLAWEAEHKK